MNKCEGFAAVISHLFTRIYQMRVCW